MENILFYETHAEVGGIRTIIYSQKVRETWERGGRRAGKKRENMLRIGEST
jgi:hypothetical protein